ncbi:Uncharacterised protein [Klebsiella variicola]|nr:Uncharacterised protein [Klebsiella variicola]
MKFAAVMKIDSRSFMTMDGGSLDDVHVHGVVTFTIIDVRQDEGSV